jgi:predicted dehydrogenase
VVLRAAVIGAGFMGTRYADLFAQHRQIELVAICDLDGRRAGEQAAATGARAYTDLGAMLDGERLDFVYVATPDPSHREPVLAAAGRGLHILVEKPLATTLEDARAMLAAVERAGVKAEVNFSNRWNPPFVAAKRALEAGEIGEVVSLNARLNSSIKTPQTLPWAARSTVAWFLHTHAIDLDTWLTGRRVASVYASGVRKKLVGLGIDTYDAIHAVLRYEDGTDGAFEALWVLPEGMPADVDFKYQVIGTAGALFVDTHDQMIHKVTAQKRTHETTLRWSAARLEAFLDVIERDLPPQASFQAGVENTGILVALHRSLASGAVEPVGAG